MLFLRVRRVESALRSGRQTATLLFGLVSYSLITLYYASGVAHAQSSASDAETSLFAAVTPWSHETPYDSARAIAPSRSAADYIRLVDRRYRRSDNLLRSALSCRGVPYVRGGTGRGGFDCSGFTQYVYARQGVYLPRTAADQAGVGTRISRSDLRPGDLVFFAGTYKRGISHVGIYLGNGNFIHAPRSGTTVRVDDLDSSYYRSHWAFGRRIR